MRIKCSKRGLTFSFKENETIKAEATFNERGWINGYKVA